jgi:hypothetical protein
VAEEPTPTRRNRGPVLLLYLAIAIAMVGILRLVGRGWIGAITAGIVLAGVVGTLVVLAGSLRRGR